MRKLNSLLIIAAAMLFGACSNDDALHQQQPNGNTAPQIIASLGEETRAGVVEDANYTQGEQFYWSNGDQTNVFFKGVTQTTPAEYVKGAYTAGVTGKSNSATFNHNGAGLANGTYTAYGIFPVAAWNLDAASADFLKVTVPATQTQTAANSTHLSAYLPLRAQNEIIVDGSTLAHLSYKQLAAVARFAIWNNSGNTNLKLKDISIRTASNQQLFGVTGKLASLDATSITVNTAERVSKITLNLTGDARNFAAKDGKQQCEGYMALLPTATALGNAVVELTLTDGTNNYTLTKNIPATLVNATIQQGKSYFFRYEIKATDLAAGQKIVKKWIALGNSITKHAANMTFWWGEWGMAATVKEKDYVHVLNDLFEEEYETDISFKAVNIALWEQNLTTFNKESIRSQFAGDEEVVVIRLGENVPSNQATYDIYKAELTNLVTFLKTLAPNATFVLTGTFWSNPTKNTIQEAVADENNCIWVPLSHLDTPANKSTLNTQVFGDDNQWHPISDGGTTATGVANHPGDLGMENIAKAIFNGIKNPNPNPTPDPDYVPEIISLDYIPDINATSPKWEILSRSTNYAKLKVIGQTPFLYTKKLTKELPAGAVMLSFQYKSDKPTGEQFKVYLQPNPSEARAIRFPSIPANTSGEWVEHKVDLSPLLTANPTFGKTINTDFLMLVFGDGANSMGMTIELQNIQIKMKK